MATAVPAPTASTSQLKTPPPWTYGVIVAAVLFLAIASSIRSCNENAEGRADVTKCENTEGDWIALTPDLYKGSEGQCVIRDSGKCLNIGTEKWINVANGFYRGYEGKCITGPKPAPVPVVVKVRERLRTAQTLEIPQEGLRVWLEEAPAIYPKLGSIRVRTPSGRSYTDTPGVDYYPGYESAGWYTFHPQPSGAERKVQIYNRW